MWKDIGNRVFPGDTKMARFMRAYAWSDSPLGKPESWPVGLQTAVELCLGLPAAAYVVWGIHQIILYNDAGLNRLSLDSHTGVFARSGRASSIDRWPELGVAVEDVLRDGRPRRVSLGNGAVASCMPLAGDSGEVEGVLCVCADAPVAVATEPQAPLEQMDPVAPGRKRRVLVIDGDRNAHAEIRELLQSEYIVDAVVDGATAIDQARRNPPAAILMDPSVAGIAGLALLRALRAEPLTSHVPVVITSERTAEDARIAALCAGADDYVSKPYSGRELVARLRTQIQLAHARMEIGAVRAAARAKDDFLALLGHELRNPLAALSTTVQALALRTASAEAELMERAVRNLGRLVDDLLDISHLARGNIQIDRAPVEIAQVVDDAIERIQSLLKERETQVFVLAPRSGLAVDCDRQRLSQVIANVLSNACKFSASGASVTLHAMRIEERVQIRIKDTGCGIDPGRLPTVFDAFNHSRDVPGLGIGLSIARSLIELHDGTITIASPGVGRGTECVIEMPFRAAAAVGDPAQLAKRARKRVLLVEDNHDTALALKRGLEQLGYQVALAHNGPVALTVARSFQPDVALLDIGLPVMDGWELARRLRELRVPSRELHFVAVTARDQDADKQKSQEAGFADHLVKPIDLAKLERVVENLPPSAG